jgi:hypothetical protein
MPVGAGLVGCPTLQASNLALEMLAGPVDTHSLVGDVSMWNPPTAPRTPREALEAAISAAIDLLDSAEMLDLDLEQGADLEPDADEEPSLGSSNDYHGSKSQGQWGEGTPIMGWDADREGPEKDLSRPSAASAAATGRASRRPCGRRARTDAEGGEHDGAEPDEDGEPSHGCTVALNQDMHGEPRTVTGAVVKVSRHSAGATVTERSLHQPAGSFPESSALTAQQAGRPLLGIRLRN